VLWSFDFLLNSNPAPNALVWPVRDLTLQSKGVAFRISSPFIATPKMPGYARYLARLPDNVLNDNQILKLRNDARQRTMLRAGHFGKHGYVCSRSSGSSFCILELATEHSRFLGGGRLVLLFAMWIPFPVLATLTCGTLSSMADCASLLMRNALAFLIRYRQRLSSFAVDVSCGVHVAALVAGSHLL
jgi:hypothetical protein